MSDRIDHAIRSWPERAGHHRPEGIGRKGEPWIARGAIEWIAGYLQPHHRVLEFGAGSSTLWFAERAKWVVSVEDDAAWAERVLDALEEGHFDNVTLRPIKPEMSEWIRACAVLQAKQWRWDLILVDCNGVDVRRAIVAQIWEHRMLTDTGVLVVDNATEVGDVPGSDRSVMHFASGIEDCGIENVTDIYHP